MKSRQAGAEQPQQQGLRVSWLYPGDGAWSGGSRHHWLQWAGQMGFSLPTIPRRGERFCAVQQSRLNSGFSGLGPGTLWYDKALLNPEQVSTHSHAKSYCSEGTQIT